MTTTNLISSETRSICLVPERNALSALLVDLSIRKSNDHIGSGKGGNPSQLLFLLNKNCQWKCDHHSNKITITEKGNKLLFVLPEKVNLEELREALDMVFDQSPDKNNFTEQQVSDPTFLSSLEVKKEPVLLLIRALEVATEIADSLKYQKDFMDKIDIFFSKEENEIKSSFLKEMNLPDNYFEISKKNRFSEFSDKDFKEFREDVMGSFFDESNDSIDDHLRLHPVWGAKLKAIADRKDAMLNSLLGQSDIDKFLIFKAMPTHTTLFALRTKVELTNMVVHDLEQTPIVGEILKSMNESILNLLETE